MGNEPNKIDIFYIDFKNFTKNRVFENKEEILLHFYKIIHNNITVLKDTGFLFVKTEYKLNSDIKIICDNIMREENFVANFCVVNHPSRLTLTENNVINYNDYLLCYKKSKKARLNLLESEDNFIYSRITKNGNKISRLEIKRGIRCESNISTIYKEIIGGESEPIRILNEEGMIIKDGVLINDVLIEGPFCNPNYIKKYFNNEEVYDRRGQQIVEVYLKKTGIPYTKKVKKGELPTSIIFEVWSDNNSFLTDKEKEIIIIKKIIDISAKKKSTFKGLYIYNDNDILKEEFKSVKFI